MQNISRVIVGIVAIPIVVAVIFFLPAIFFVVLIMAVTGVGLYEYFSLVPEALPLSLKGMFALMGGVLPLISYHGAPVWGIGWLLLILVMLMVFSMGILTDYKKSFSLVGGNLLGFVFVALPLSVSLPIIKWHPYGRGWVLWLVLVVWAGDTGAYYLGTRFGKHKLYPRVSPKKSLEGVVGGLVSALAVGVLAALAIPTGFRLREILILPLILLILGQLGDFAESMLKRGAGVKDSSRILGGHGGVLDRIDSFLFTIPFFYFYLLLRP